MVEAALYAAVDRIAVEPAFTIACGRGDGPACVPARFEAIGFWNGPDGAPGGAGDIRIGDIPAHWSIADHGEAAAARDDAKYAGVIDAASGLFTPGIAGPNPACRFSPDNAGELKATAHAAGHEAEAQLIVTVERFVDPRSAEGDCPWDTCISNPRPRTGWRSTAATFCFTFPPPRCLKSTRLMARCCAFSPTGAAWTKAR